MHPSSELLTWERPYYQYLDLAPQLAYFVLGAQPENLQLDRLTYRCDGVPTGLDVEVVDTESVLALLKQTHLLGFMQKNHPQLLTTIGEHQHSTLIRGSLEDHENLNYLRNTIGLISCLLDNGGTGVYDAINAEFWTSEQWKDTFFSSEALDVYAHANLLVFPSTDPFTRTIQTVGMQKFGRPDIRAENFDAEHLDGMVEMMNRLISYQALGGVIPNHQMVDMDGVPEGLMCEYTEEDRHSSHVMIYIVPAE